LKRENLTINIPNIITVIRILLIPLFIIYLQRGVFLEALIVFSVMALSDGIDGLLARSFNQRTMLGAYLDPIADKFLLTSAFVCLAIYNLIPNWVAVIIISRDIMIVIGIAVLVVIDVKLEIKPNFDSKCTTVLQLLTVFVVLLGQVVPWVYIKEHTFILYILTSGLTVWSGFHYLYIWLNIFQDASGE